MWKNLDVRHDKKTNSSTARSNMSATGSRLRKITVWLSVALPVAHGRYRYNGLPADSDDPGYGHSRALFTRQIG